MSARTIHLFTDVHMGMSHKALTELARKQEGIDVATLAPGNILMFLNRKRDKLKILGAHGLVVGYLSVPGGIALEAIQYIPRTFGANGTISYPQALKRSLEERMSRTQQVRAQTRSRTNETTLTAGRTN